MNAIRVSRVKGTLLAIFGEWLGEIAGVLQGMKETCVEDFARVMGGVSVVDTFDDDSVQLFVP